MKIILLTLISLISVICISCNDNNAGTNDENPTYRVVSLLKVYEVDKGEMKTWLKSNSPETYESIYDSEGKAKKGSILTGNPEEIGMYEFFLNKMSKEGWRLVTTTQSSAVFEK